MAHNNNKSKIQEPVMEPKAPPQLTVKQGTSKPLLSIGAALMALSALGTSLYTVSMNQQLQTQLTEQNNHLAAQIKQLSSKEDSIQEQLASKTEKIEETKTILQTKFDNLNKELQTALSQRFYHNQDWILLKARYFLELAQMNAYWSKSDQATISLLQQADQLLQDVSDPGVFEIRQAIAKDIAQIQASPTIDTAGILSQLDAAQQSVAKLSIANSLTDINPAADNAPAPSNDSDSIWQLRMQDSMKLLRKLVVIRHHEDDIKPLISPNLEAVIKENIRLNLQEAQWAVLNKNADVYQLVLKQALASLKQNFNPGAQSTAALIKQLTDLQQVNLTIKAPEIGVGLPLLNQYIEKKASMKNQSDKTQGGNSK